MKKLDTILLIDDNEHDNFFHEIVIEEADCAHEVISIQDPTEALDYLASRNGSTNPHPELVFLDINMPMMDGFELLEKHRNLISDQNLRPVFVILTTSLNPIDKKRADEFSEVSMFALKPLSQEILDTVISSYVLDN